MARYCYLFLTAVVFSFNLFAAPGDTTWVQANNVQLNYYNKFDTMVVFPSGGLDKSYRKIYMIFTLGKYTCPPGSQYCASWDYTVLNYLMTPAGDTLELGRFITPYATTGDPRTPANFSYRYIYDVTDYYPLLKDTAAMRILYSGYSGGFTGNIRFAFIEGTPERNVMGISMLWTGSHAFGDTAHPISNYFPALSETVPSGTVASKLKFIVTGHGSDNNMCCEFMPHNYDVVLNGTAMDTTTIWRPDCGSNELYPQTGTWVYERGNWCPGALVFPHYHDLPGLAARSNFNIDINFDQYADNGAGSYTTEASIFHYAGFNKTLDASIDDIIAPSDFEGHYRENPFDGTPLVQVRNTGSTTITSMIFAYGVVGSPLAYYTWYGNLPPLTDSIISLPEPFSLRQVSGTTTTSKFTVSILDANNTIDDDSTNNTLVSTFSAAPMWPVNFVVSMHTNADPDPSNGSICATSWTIYDLFGKVVAQRTNAALSTLYNDTVFLGPAVYKLVVTDVNCSGLHWWADPNEGTGSIRVKKTTGVNIPLNGNIENNGTYNDDFGCGFTQYFTANWPLGVTSVTGSNLKMEVYPSPAQNTTTVTIEGISGIDGTLKLMDVTGRVVLEQSCNKNQQSIDVSRLANGLYNLVFVDKSAPDNFLSARLLIAK